MNKLILKAVTLAVFGLALGSTAPDSALAADCSQYDPEVWRPLGLIGTGYDEVQVAFTLIAPSGADGNRITKVKWPLDMDNFAVSGDIFSKSFRSYSTSGQFTMERRRSPDMNGNYNDLISAIYKGLTFKTLDGTRCKWATDPSEWPWWEGRLGNEQFGVWYTPNTLIPSNIFGFIAASVSPSPSANHLTPQPCSVSECPDSGWGSTSESYSVNPNATRKVVVNPQTTLTVTCTNNQQTPYRIVVDSKNWKVKCDHVESGDDVIATRAFQIDATESSSFTNWSRNGPVATFSAT